MSIIKSRKHLTIVLAVLAVMLLAALPAAAAGGDGGFVHAPTIDVDGEAYYMAPGAPDGVNGAPDIPGHFWIQTGPDQLIGKHYNTGPFGAPNWWSSNAGNGELLYIVKAKIDTWSPMKAEMYARKRFTHYHELVRADDYDATGKETLHPTKVVWLKHTARTSFTLNGGPHSEFYHEVTPGIDWKFIPNGTMPYNPS